VYAFVPYNFQEIPSSSLINQDLSWGVVVLNSSKGRYELGKETKVAIGVLDEKGTMVCDADLTLDVLSAQGELVDQLSTQNGRIIVNDTCFSKEPVPYNRPDFEAKFKLNKVGHYALVLTARTKNGERRIKEQIEVKEKRRFSFRRRTPTRINPEHEYPVEWVLKSKEIVKGDFVISVPSEFIIKPPEGCRVFLENNRYHLKCPVELSPDNPQVVQYWYKAPEHSPYVYELGPAVLFDDNGQELYRETRTWKVAVDPRINYPTTGSTSVDANQGSRVKLVKLMTNRYVQCYSDNGAGQCRAGVVEGQTVTQGAEEQFDGDIALGTVPQSTLGLCKVADDKFAVAFTDDGSLDDGYVTVGQVNDTTITYGPTLEFLTTDMESAGCAQLSDNKIIICYNNEGDATTDVGECVACDVDASLNVACGANTDMNATDYFPYSNAPVNIGADKFVVAFDEQEGGVDGEVIAGTVAGTVITFGNPVTFDTDNVEDTATCAPEDDDRFVIVYRDATNSSGSIMAGTVTAGAGTVITMGAEADFNPSSEDVANPGCTFISANEVLVAYEDVTDSQHGKSALCTVNWTTRAVTCAPEQTFEASQIGSAASGGVDEMRGIDTLAGYNLTTGKVAIGFILDAAGDDTEIIIGDRGPLLGSVMVVN
jgi:hypothetical protein